MNKGGGGPATLMFLSFLSPLFVIYKFLSVFMRGRSGNDNVIKLLGIKYKVFYVDLTFITL